MPSKRGSLPLWSLSLGDRTVIPAVNDTTHSQSVTANNSDSVDSADAVIGKGIGIDAVVSSHGGAQALNC